MKSPLLLAVLLAAPACSSSSASPTAAIPADASTAADAASVPDASSTTEGSSGEGGPDLDTWDNWAEGFFATYCVECHSATNPDGLDFAVQATVVANQARIRCGVSVHQDPAWSCPATPVAEQFPISDSAGTNPKPSDAERDRLVAWVDAGCP